ncbi:30S ribosomal protein S17 [Blattabacterium cuenoti]|nr:30S ribosomal protein S17 [Blattabacterium cuenoti]
MSKRGHRKKRQGIVVSDKMQKTIIVSEIRKVQHKYYGKSIIRKKRYMVHDEKSLSKIGDKVMIMESRPISKRKTWRLISVIEKFK